MGPAALVQSGDVDSGISESSGDICSGDGPTHRPGSRRLNPDEAFGSCTSAEVSPRGTLGVLGESVSAEAHTLRQGSIADSRDAVQVDTDGEAEFIDEQQDSQRRMLTEDQKSNPTSP